MRSASFVAEINPCHTWAHLSLQPLITPIFCRKVWTENIPNIKYKSEHAGKTREKNIQNTIWSRAGIYAVTAIYLNTSKLKYAYMMDGALGPKFQPSGVGITHGQRTSNAPFRALCHTPTHLLSPVLDKPFAWMWLHLRHVFLHLVSKIFSLQHFLLYFPLHREY